MLAPLKPPSSFGEAALVCATEPRDHTVTAVTFVVALLLSKAGFRRALDAAPDDEVQREQKRLCAGLFRDPRLVPSPLIGKPAPVFSLSSLKAPHRILTADDLKGNRAAAWTQLCHAVLGSNGFLFRE